MSNEKGWVFGRMCVWAGGEQLGDLDEPACMLNVTANHLSSLVKRLSTLEEPAFDSLSDTQLFELLDCKLYRDDDRTTEDVAADASEFFRFDFLTNGGESFDHSKSFVTSFNGKLRLVFVQASSGVLSARFESAAFVSVVAAFLAWLSSEGASGG
jgi:hypothetical protein